MRMREQLNGLRHFNSKPRDVWQEQPSAFGHFNSRLSPCVLIEFEGDVLLVSNREILRGRRDCKFAITTLSAAVARPVDPQTFSR